MNYPSLDDALVTAGLTVMILLLIFMPDVFALNG
mgnify:CR=1 FL=1